MFFLPVNPSFPRAQPDNALSKGQWLHPCYNVFDWSALWWPLGSHQVGKGQVVCSLISAVKIKASATFRLQHCHALQLNTCRETASVPLAGASDDGSLTFGLITGPESGAVDMSDSAFNACCLPTCISAETPLSWRGGLRMLHVGASFVSWQGSRSVVHLLLLLLPAMQTPH